MGKKNTKIRLAYPYFTNELTLKFCPTQDIHSRYEIFVTITTLSYPFHQTIFLEINKFFFFFSKHLKRLK